MCVWSFEWKSDALIGVFGVHSQSFDFSLINFIIWLDLGCWVTPCSFHWVKKSQQRLCKIFWKSMTSALRPRLYALIWLLSANVQVRLKSSEWIWSPDSYNLHELLLHDRLGGYHLVLFSCYQKKKKNIGRLPLSLQCFSISAPKNWFYLTLSPCWGCGCGWGCSSTLTKWSSQLSVIKKKGHLFKVSSLDGFWASKSQSLFSMHHFTRLDGNLTYKFYSGRNRERAVVISIQVSQRCCLAILRIHLLIRELRLIILETELKKKTQGVCSCGTPEQCRKTWISLWNAL